MADQEKKSGSKGNLLKIIIIVLLAAVLIGGGVFGGYIFATKTGAATVNENTQNEGTDAVEQKTFSLVDDFVINLKSEGKPAFLKAQIYLGYPVTKESEKMEAELQESLAPIRDTINTILRSKKAEDFTEAGVEKIKGEIKNKVNPLLHEGQILDVYFYELIIQ